MSGIFQRMARLVRHRLAEWRLARLLPREKLQELEHLIAQSELGHTGQVRICIEAGLPASYVWRGATARERAINMFSKLRVWDTEHNNGVLIYLLLAEHAIEIVADRGLNRHVTPQRWRELAQGMSASFKAGHFEDGLAAAIDAVELLLQQHFPLAEGVANPNELPDAPFVG